MVQKDKSILIISYDFPPSKNVGARRWGKFAKYLNNLGYDVHVICAKRIYEENSLWIDTLDSINVHELSVKYPPIFDINPDTLFKKIRYKIWCWLLGFYSKGTIFDRALFWKKQLLNKVSEVIKLHSISNVICTGAPFRLLYYTTLLKRQIPNLNVISDLRDPWTWGHGYGYSRLPQEKMKFELMMEKQVMMYSSNVIAPAQEMIDYLTEKHPFYRHKFSTLPHGYDANEISPKEKSQSFNKKKKLIFYGLIYEQLNEVMHSLAGVLKRYENSIELHFYSESQNYKSIFDEKQALNVFYHSAIPSDKLFEKFKETDFILIAYPSYAKNILSTKFFEIIYSRTPIVYIADGGSTGDFIKNHGLGIYIKPNQIEIEFEKICNTEFKFDYNYEFDVSNYSFDNLTYKLESLFI